MNEHSDVEELKAEANVPVINALSDLHHPLQTLADLMTMQVLCSILYVSYMLRNAIFFVLLLFFSFVDLTRTKLNLVAPKYA